MKRVNVIGVALLIMVAQLNLAHSADPKKNSESLDTQIENMIAGPYINLPLSFRFSYINNRTEISNLKVHIELKLKDKIKPVEMAASSLIDSNDKSKKYSDDSSSSIVNLDNYKLHISGLSNKVLIGDLNKKYASDDLSGEIGFYEVVGITEDGIPKVRVSPVILEFQSEKLDVKRLELKKLKIVNLHIPGLNVSPNSDDSSGIDPKDLLKALFECKASTRILNLYSGALEDREMTACKLELDGDDYEINYQEQESNVYVVP